MDITSYLLGKNASGGGGGSDLDWSAIGYENPPLLVVEGYNYAVQVKNNWVQKTDLSNNFSSDTNLVYMPLVDTSISTVFQNMFYSCERLQEVPLLDTKNAQITTSMFYNCIQLRTIPTFNISNVQTSGNIKNMFYNCPLLTDDSLNNILNMCINASSYTGTKTLYQLGLRSSNYSTTRIEALSNYQDFLDAGWTIGY